MAIEIRNLTVVYNENTPNETVVFDNYSVEFKKGEITVITGGNGTGKSTLLNVILGTLPIKSGRIIVEGKDITKWSALKRSRLFGVIHQDTMLGTCPNLTIQENFQLTNSKRWWSLLPYKRSLTEEQKDAIKQTGLPLEEKGSAMINTLSGGQRQAIASSLALESGKQIILLDEFTSALDKKATMCVWEICVALTKKKGATLIMIIHDMLKIKEQNVNILDLEKGSK